MRLFVSVDLPAEIRRTLFGWLPSLPHLRYEKEEKLHLTLLFLGECDDDQIDSIKQRLRTIDFEPFWITVRGIGAFPYRKNPRVLWAGVEKSDELNDLQRQVRGLLSAFVNQKGNPPFKPHITLARTKKGFSEQATENLFKMTEPLSVKIQSVTLKKSELTDEGSIHFVLEKIVARG
jgi:2'-5' RNA ligase